MKRFFPFFCLAFLVFSTLACKAATQILLDPTPTPTIVPSPTPTLAPPTSTPRPLPSATPDTCPNGDCITSCLNQLTDVTRSTGSGTDSKSTRKYFVANDEYTLVTYDVAGDELENPVDESGLPKNIRDYQNDSATQERIWKYFAAIIPPENRKYLKAYVVFTDGKDNLLASVAQSSRSPNDWALSVDIMDAFNPQDLTFTLVHEYGHLLTLNPSQVVPSQAVFNHPDKDRKSVV